MLFRVIALLALALALTSCETTLSWAGAHPEDPSPSGPSYLRSYKESHYRDLGVNFVGKVSRAELIAELRNARVLFLGDHHRDELLHDQMLQLIEELADAGLRPVIGTESIGVQDEDDLRDYFSGSVTMAEFSRRLKHRWNDSWLTLQDMDTMFYRDVIRLARRRDLSVFALEPTPRQPLDRRDQLIADRVREIASLHPGNLVVVIVGHAHLLGQGDLVHRVALPHIAVGARLSVTLQQIYDGMPRSKSEFLRTDAGVLFFNPPPSD